MSAERIQVIGEPGAIVVRGTRPVPLVPSLSMRRLEIPYGIFERRILLPSSGMELEPPEVEKAFLIVRLRKVGGT
ncbi:Hsp20/alpha crystallin family protein [Variovorax sp. J22R115]|uniref:Hsp20/alpha crystallin family protein n=1 Tax=Variovorax sp. J22R115 TaxID=3053509 RepID=UPI00257810D4|nr:Hsp20/alpha crystallin family protein [Variovorax sp. J22R115]MDM0047535.1 Hsp20/alpha crystallin family protein [Variovorax sp. J22R115]